VVDPARVRSKLQSLTTYTARLRVLAAMDESAYLASHAYEGRYLVQAAAQVCIDLANHLIASSGWPPATEFRQAFDRLHEQAVLPADLARRLQDLTGLRNRLVHLYDDVDDTLVHAGVRHGLADLDEFAVAYARAVDGAPTSDPS
jgi:uncharacterized protein YutE (UPF0331/DUF86 family)